MRSGPAFAAVCLGLLLGCDTPSPASLEFVEMVPAQPRLGEIATVKFRVVDSRGEAMAGALVSFRLESEKPGVTLHPTEAVATKGEGIAATQVVATRATSVVVIAEAGDKSVATPAISFAGTIASAAQFTFQCGPIGGPASGGVHAIGAYDATRHLIAGIPLDCTAHVGDRNGDGVPGALVSFLTEAGTIGPTQTSMSDVIGNATVLYKTSYPLPQDVDPGSFSWTPNDDATHTGEYIAPLWMHPFTWVANPITQFGTTPTFQEPRRTDPIRPGVTLNPRDNLVSLIAFTTGEEAFDDLNNNGLYDPGEPFVDLTEPFVDNDDNGTWDPGERYVDFNANGRWDGKNGSFDASTLIWVQERILWTGMPHEYDTSGTEPVFRVISPTTPQAISHMGSVAAVFLVADPWYNSPAQNGSDDACTVEGSEVVVAEPAEFNGPGIAFTYPPGRLISVVVRDAHDPVATPPPSPHGTAVPFSLSARCAYTASPKDGHRYVIGVPLLTGTVL